LRKTSAHEYQTHYEAISQYILPLDIKRYRSKNIFNPKNNKALITQGFVVFN